MEDVRAGAVVDDDGLLQVPVEQAQVLDVVALVVDAGLAEEAGPDGVLRIEQVEETFPNSLSPKGWLHQYIYIFLFYFYIYISIS